MNLKKILNNMEQGLFSGQLESDFFIYKDSVYMDEVHSEVDGYYNNQYEGVWKSYKNNAIKKSKFWYWAHSK